LNSLRKKDAFFKLTARKPVKNPTLNKLKSSSKHKG